MLQGTSELLFDMEPWQRTPAIKEAEELHRDLTAMVGTREG